MRRAWSASVLPLALAFAMSTFAFGAAHAQKVNVAAPFLLLPLGAQSAGQGEAVVADTSIGTESLWWNAAGLARLRKREIVVHDSRTASAVSDMIAFAVPSKVLGTVALAGYIVNLGDNEATDSVGTTTGTITSRYYMLSASYATPVGKRLSAGISAKFVMIRFLCSGCATNALTLSGNTSAFDVGGQYIVPTSLPLTLGLSVRNLGPALQVKDAAQADPLPRIVQAGAHATLPIDALTKNSLKVDAMSDVFLSPAYAHPVLNMGSTLTYKSQLTLRGGYKSSNGNFGVTGTFTAGAGIRRGGTEFDIAREFNSASVALGQPPTFVSLRLLF